jgi:hypothetical protein
MLSHNRGPDVGFGDAEKAADSKHKLGSGLKRNDQKMFRASKQQKLSRNKNKKRF